MPMFWIVDVLLILLKMYTPIGFVERRSENLFEVLRMCCGNCEPSYGSGGL